MKLLVARGEMENIKQSLHIALDCLKKSDGSMTKKNFSAYCRINNALFRIEQIEQTQAYDNKPLVNGGIG